MLKVHKVTAYQNAEGKERVMITAVREMPILGGLASSKQFGTITLNEDAKVKDVEKAYPVGSELKGVKLGAIKEDSISHWIVAE